MDNIEQKATELVEQFYKNCRLTIAGAGSLWMPLAKKQAMLCVDEIIGSHKSKSPNYESETYWHPIDYWQQVKEKIQSL